MNVMLKIVGAVIAGLLTLGVAAVVILPYETAQSGGPSAIARPAAQPATQPSDARRAVEQRAVPRSRRDMQLSFAPLVKDAAPAVVNVYAERMIRQRSPFEGDPFFERFFGQQFPDRSRRTSSLGSGVIVEDSGLVVTNFHVIENADEIRVALHSGREYASTVVLKDERFDLAVLRINADSRFPTLPFGDSDALEVGDLVLAIGNPFGVGQTVTSGIVSGLARNQVGVSDFGFFIQTDAAINPGNSGGALIDMNGRLIGINTAIYSRSGGSNGIGFAIPANLVRAVADAARDGRARFEQPFIGATFEPVTSDIAEALGLSEARGALVAAVMADGPAAKAGLRPGDVVVALDGLTVDHPDALGYRLATAGIGRAVELEVISQNRRRALGLTLARAPQTVPPDERRIDGDNPFAGARVANLSPRLAVDLDIPAERTGVVIVDVAPRSPADRLGLRRRDILVAVNAVSVNSTRQLQRMLARPARYWRFDIDRDGRILRQIVR